MCPLSPPPAALVVPWPWQAPVNWIGFGLSVAFVAWIVVGQRRKALQRGTVAVGRQPWWNQLWIRLTIPLIGLFLILLVMFPSLQRDEAWYDSQLSRFASGNQHCSLSSLITIHGQQFQIVMITLFIAIGLSWLNLLLTVVAGRSTLRRASIFGSQ